MEGRGVLTWKDGRKYEGNFKKDKKEGFGVFTFRDGRVYEGQWKDGLQHGKGVLKKHNVLSEGMWWKGRRIRHCERENDEPDDASFS